MSVGKAKVYLYNILLLVHTAAAFSSSSPDHQQRYSALLLSEMRGNRVFQQTNKRKSIYTYIYTILLYMHSVASLFDDQKDKQFFTGIT